MVLRQGLQKKAERGSSSSLPSVLRISQGAREVDSSMTTAICFVIAWYPWLFVLGEHVGNWLVMA